MRPNSSPDTAGDTGRTTASSAATRTAGDLPRRGTDALDVLCACERGTAVAAGGRTRQDVALARRRRPRRPLEHNAALVRTGVDVHGEFQLDPGT